MGNLPYQSAWNDPISSADTAPSQFQVQSPMKGFGQLGTDLDQSKSSDMFGLGSSTSSGGFALDDLVSKIVDDDPAQLSLNGKFSFDLHNQDHSDPFNYDR